MKKSCLVLALLILPLVSAFSSNLLIAVAEEVSDDGKSVVSPVRFRLVEEVLGFGFDRGDVVTDLFLGKPQADQKTRLQREMDLNGSNSVVFLALIWKTGPDNYWTLERVDWEIYYDKGKKTGKKGQLKASLTVPGKAKDPVLDSLANEMMEMIRKEL